MSFRTQTEFRNGESVAPISFDFCENRSSEPRVLTYKKPRARLLKGSVNYSLSTFIVVRIETRMRVVRTIFKARDEAT
jgi:hypothetical protein